MRAGVFTLAVTLVAAGGALLAFNLGYVRLPQVLQWWPLVLVFLGVEVLVRQAWVRARGRGSVAWDRASVVVVILITLLLAGGHWAAVAADQYLGPAWPWEMGWFPGTEAQKTLTASHDVGQGVKALEVDNQEGSGIRVRIVGEGERVEGELQVTQPGPTEEAATRLAGEWQLQVQQVGETIRIRVLRPDSEPRRRGASGQLLVRAPSSLQLKIENSFSPVEVRGVAACQVANRFGEVNIENVPGPVDVRNQHGAVRVAGRGTPLGQVTVYNEFGEVNVTEARGPVRVENRQGEVRVDWAENPTGDSRLQTEFGAMRVTLPPGAALQVDAETRFGRIEVPSGVGLQVENREPEAALVRGTIGAGGPRLVLRNQHGDIVITGP